jgi:hypothetical protein
MTGRLVVHVVGGDADPVALAALGRRGRDRHAIGRPDPTADVVVLHGRRAGWQGRSLRDGRCVVVHRPDPGVRPGLAERRFLRWCDLVAAPDPGSATAFAAALERPAASAVVLDDATDPAAWEALVDQLLPAAAAPGHDPGPLDPTVRLHPVQMAARDLGADLLLARPGADQGVERLTATAPAIWGELAGGASVAEAARAVAPDGADAEIGALVTADVGALARHLVRLGLAVPA